MVNNERPLYLAHSVQELANSAENIDIDKSIKIYQYLLTSKNLISMADIYKKEGDMEKSYVYLLRFCILVIEKLPAHPGYAEIKGTASYSKMMGDVIDRMKESEVLKKSLDSRYKQVQKERDDEIRRKKEAERALEKEREERRLKEEQEKILRQEREETEELEREIRRIQEETNEQASFNKRKQEAERKLRQNNFKRQAELIKLETQRELLKEQELVNSLESLQNNTTTTNSANSYVPSNGDLLIDLPGEFIPVPKPSAPIINDTPTPQQKSPETTIPSPTDIQLPPTTTTINESNQLSPPQPNIHSNDMNNQKIPTSYDGYPSFQQIESTNSPKPTLPTSPYISNQQSPPQQQGIPRFVNSPVPQLPQNHYYNPNIPTIPNQNYNQRPMNTNSPPYVNLSNPPLQIPGVSPPMYNYNNQLPVVYRNNSSPAVPLANNSYLSKIQTPQPPHQLHQQPHLPSTQQLPQIVSAANSPGQQAPPTVATPKPKANIDSPDASKKFAKLRKVIVNGELLQDFMKMADSNTRNSIETCGILSGSLSNDIFRVTTLIIPKQEGTTDTCNTVDEHEIFEYQLENDLLTLGWIHTHPTQDCFLSAVDVHTHCSYQLMLPEAVAIVMAPRANPNFGIFRLTDPPGVQTVQKCKLKSFHPHPPVNGIPIYTKSDHIDLVWGKYESKVVDLRKKK